MYPTLASFNKMKILLFLLCLTFVYGNQCNPPLDGCEECDAAGLDCEKCINPDHYIKDDKQGCVEKCEDGFYGYTPEPDSGGSRRLQDDDPEELPKECRPCRDDCAKCTSDEDCIACKDGLFPNGDGDECKDDCPPDKLKYEITVEQDDGEEEIWGECVTKPECTARGRYIYEYTDDSTAELGECLVSCGDGKRADEEAPKKCYDCETGCKTCDDENDCTSCLDPAKFVKNKAECVAIGDCDNGYFPVVSTKECKRCGTNCIKCDALHLCTDCGTEKYVNDAKTGCAENCGDGFYKSDGPPKACEPCGPYCTCAGTNACTGCTTNDKYFKGNTECVTKEDCIAASHFVTNEKCNPCHLSCQTCKGANDDDCLTCKILAPWLEEGKCVVDCAEGKYEHDTTQGKKCLNNCPDTYYKYDADMSCKKCGDYCQVCTDVDSCTECIEESGHEYLEDGECLDECSEGMWIYEDGKECFESKDDCPEDTRGEVKEDGKNYCVAITTPPPPPDFGSYLFSGVAIVLALVTFI